MAAQKQRTKYGRYILWIDEVKFIRHGYMNVYNDHLWMIKNLHVTASIAFEERFSVNVWVGLQNQFIGTYIFDQSINSQRYRNFLRENLD